MAGIYVHIPYCKVKCHYCDFHFSTKTDSKNEMVEALRLEIRQRAPQTNFQEVSTIYFGGGTPSLLTENELSLLMDTIHQEFKVTPDVEVTLECNPDDLSKKKLADLKAAGVNRLSIGIQSFDNDVLKLMNRAHNADEATASIKMAQDVGFENLTADLIYGIPDKDLNYWESQLDQMLALNVPHISSYCLTIEPNTVFNHRYQKNELNLPSDELSRAQFELMVSKLTPEFEHYEISNFGKEGFISRHNSAYWRGKPYLGIGPSAHSYDLKNRGWNISNNLQYLKLINEGGSFHEIETLSKSDKFNDYILTSLRTKWGISLNEVEALGQDLSLIDFNKNLKKHLESAYLSELDGVVRLTSEGKFIADKIASDLFV